MRSSTIHYLDEDIINTYSNVILISNQGDKLKCNFLILAALKSTLIQSFNNDLDEDLIIITEHTKEELQNVLNYCKTGEIYQSELLKSFGFLDHEVTTPEVKVDLKVKDEPFSDFESDEDYDPDYEYTPNKKIKHETEDFKKPRSLSNEELKLYETFTFPQPLETYKNPPQTMKFKENPERDESKQFQCHLCQRKCTSSQNLKGHVIKYHQDHYNCPKCFKSFPLDETEAFRLHLFKHEYLLTPRPNKCIHCGKVFKINKILQTHLKKVGPHHNDECAQCSFRFTTYEEYVGEFLSLTLSFCNDLALI